LPGTKSRIPGCPASSPISVITVESNISYCIGHWKVDWIYLAEETVQSDYDKESQVSVKVEKFLDYLSDYLFQCMKLVLVFRELKSSHDAILVLWTDDNSTQVFVFQTAVD
jgi:hypothetical protein